MDGVKLPLHGDYSSAWLEHRNFLIRGSVVRIYIVTQLIFKLTKNINAMKSLLTCPNCGSPQHNLSNTGIVYKCGSTYDTLGKEAKTFKSKCSSTTNAIVKGEL